METANGDLGIRLYARALLVAVVLILFARHAQAGLISAINTPPGLSLPGTPAPNNDDKPFSSNFFSSFNLTFTSMNPIDVEFAVAPTSGTTEYFVIGSVKNQTGADWGGYRMVMGTGMGDNFIPGSIADLDFDWPHRNSTTQFNSYFPSLHAAVELIWFPTVTLKTKAIPANLWVARGVWV